MTKRTQHTATFKAKVALEALKGLEPTSVLASRFGVHPSLITRWKRQLLDHAESAFSAQSSDKLAQAELREVELFEQIGRLRADAPSAMELEWLKKKAARFD